MRAIIAVARVKPERRHDFVEACLAYAASSADEAGCLRLDVIVDDGDPERICLCEAFADQTAFEEHLVSPHFRQWRDAVKDWYAEPPVVIRGNTIPSTDGGAGQV